MKLKLIILLLLSTYVCSAQDGIIFGKSLTVEGVASNTVTFDAVSDTICTDDNEGCLTISWHHISAADADGILINTGTNSSGARVSGVTVGGVSATRLVDTIDASTQTSNMFGLLDPPTGDRIVTVTLVGGTSDGSNCSAISLKNCGSFSNAVKAIGNSNTPSISVTSTTGALVIDNLCWLVDGQTSSLATSNQTRRYARLSYVGSGYIETCSATATGSASVTMSWTLPESISSYWALTAVSCNPH